MTITSPATDTDLPAEHVLTGVLPGGSFALLAARRIGEGPAYAFDRIATDGSRRIRHRAGTFRVGHWQNVDQGLRSAGPLDPEAGTPAHEVPEARAMLLRLSSPAGPHVEAYDRFARACGPSTLAYAVVGAGVTDLDAPDDRWGRSAVERVVGRIPALASALRLRERDTPKVRRCKDRIVTEDLDLDGLVGALGPILDDALAFVLSNQPDHVALFRADREDREVHAQVRLLLRRLAGVPVRPVPALAALALCHLAPRDWAPADADGVEAMADVIWMAVIVCAASGGALGVKDLIAPVRGDWIGARRSIVAVDERGFRPPPVGEGPGIPAHAGPPGTVIDGQPAWTATHLAVATGQAKKEPAGDPIMPVLRGTEIVKGVADMVDAYRAQVLAPAMAYAASATGRTLPPADASLAWKELFARKGIVAIVRASAEWHARAPDLNSLVKDVAGLAASRWPKPFPHFEAGNGLRVVPLASVAELVEEGAAMRHCVGAYGPKAASGKSVIVSIRSADGRRVSTAELRGSRVAEHKGVGNSDPGKPECEALEELAAALDRLPAGRAGLRRVAGLPTRMARKLARIAVDLASPDRGEHPYNPGDPTRIMRVAFAWGDLAPRQARGSISAIVARAMPEAAATLDARGRPGLAPIRLHLPVVRLMLWFVARPSAFVLATVMVAALTTVVIMFHEAALWEENSRQARQAYERQVRESLERLDQVRDSAATLARKARTAREAVRGQVGSLPPDEE